MKTSDIKKNMEQLDESLQVSNVEGMEDAYRSEAEGNLNISDVIEVIQTTDPDFVETNLLPGQGESGALRIEGSGATMFAGIDQSGASGVGASSVPPGAVRRRAYINILEQPASKALRFRYECEGRSAGSIPGVNSTPENKTFPAIQVVGYKGRAIVVVSCVTKDQPHKPHPHNLVGKEGCKKGVCTVEMNNENMVCTFSNLGIQCVKKKDIEEALKVREEIRVDPYRTGFAHRNQPSSIDLNAVRLCFQVFLEGSEPGKFNRPLSPVVSDPIYDKKAMSDLVICKLSDCTCSVAGGKEIILLCEKVAKEDIQIRFYEENDGQLMWEGLGDFQPTHVHKQVAISFRTPRYKKLEVEGPVKVCIQLRRPSDGATSEPLPFEFIPLDSDSIALKRKRQKIGESSPQIMRHPPLMRHGALDPGDFGLGAPGMDPSFPMNPVKCEPVDASPYVYRQGGMPPMYPVIPITSPSRLVDYPLRQPASPSPSSLAPMSPMTQPHVMVPSPSPSLSVSVPQQTPSPMGAVPGPPPNTFLVSNVVLGDQNIYNMQAPIRRDAPLPNFASTNPFMQPMNLAQAIPGSVAQPTTISAAQMPMGNMMDIEQQNFSFDLELDNLNSGDLAAMALRDNNMALFDANISKNLSSLLTISDAEACQGLSQAGGGVQQHSEVQHKEKSGVQLVKTESEGMGGAMGAPVQLMQQNMTDSLTRHITTTIEEISTLNDMYKGASNGGVNRN